MAKRILIADDSVTIQKAFAMTFGPDDVTVTLARSADEGMALAQKARPDLIIADGAMPGRSGYDLCTQIRSDPSLRGVPVYILASGQQPYDEAKGQRSGADGHLVKPWDTNAFLDRVREALSRGSGPGLAAPSARPMTGPLPTVGPTPGRASAASLPASAMEDDYGEISIDSGRDSEPVTPPPVVTAPPPGAFQRGTATSMPAMGGPGPAGMRPSLIPGMRPGAVPPARPGTVPVRPLAATGGLQPTAPPRPAPPPVGRTMIGLPAANVPIPGAMRPTAPAAPSMSPSRSPAPPGTPPSPSSSQVFASAAPAGAPFAAPPSRAREMTPTPPRPREATPLPPRPREMTPAPPRPRQMTPTPPPSLAPAAPPPSAAPLAALAPAVAATVDQTMAAIAAKGSEYEAIARLSREIIEKIAWEVVPELAEAIIREQLEKRG
jgi:CheY-like chemotaxis protein